MKLFDVKYILTFGVVFIVALSLWGTEIESKTSSEAGKNAATAIASEPEIYIDPPIDVQSESVLVENLESGRTIFQFNKDKRWPLASLTKLMTALLASELMPQDKKVVISREAVLTEGTSGDFSEGEEFTIGDLIKAMLLVSSNDAARAIALDYGEERFIKIMNDKAKDLRMDNTEFKDSVGLSLKNQGTVEDLEKLVNFIWKNEPAIFGIAKEPMGEIVNTETDEKRELKNINLFAGRADFLGGKTGTMPSVGGNLISIFDISGPKSIIVLGTEDKFSETKKIIESIWSKKP